MMFVPATTFAVLVGIERHEGQHLPDIDGPACDAARYARWLLNLGVPQENIRVLVSPLPGNVAFDDSLGRNALPATEYQIRKVLFGELPERSSGQLMIYWGGHGVSYRGGQRLFFADASSNDPKNLDLDNLLLTLRTDRYARHVAQTVVVDACQLLAEIFYPGRVLPSQTYLGGNQLLHCVQHVLLSASSGEAARNDDANKTGFFSSSVLKELERMGSAWPDHREKMWAFLVDHFGLLRSQGVVDQHPQRLVFNGGGERLLSFRGPSGREQYQYSIDSTPGSRDDALGMIADAMLAYPELQNDGLRQQIISNMPPHIVRNIFSAPTASLHVISWIKACEDYDDGEESLLGAMAFLGLERVQWRKLTHVVRVGWPKLATNAK